MQAIGRLHSCDTLAGALLLGADHQQLGRVDELLLDAESGQLAFALVRRGPMLGTFDGFELRWIAVPWSWLVFDPGSQCFRLSVAREALDEAPALDLDSWPDFTDVRWQRQLTAHFAHLEQQLSFSQLTPLH